MSLSDAISKAWSAFEAPEHQARIADQTKEQIDHAKAKTDKARLKKLISWGVPKIAARVIVRDKVEAWTAVQHVRDRPNATLLVLAGNPGCGKTLAACTRIEERDTGNLVRAADFVELGKSWQDKDRLQTLGRYGVLIVDDLGVEYRSDEMICRLDGLIDTRVSNGLTTIITTQFPKDVFQRRYEDRIWSRINQFGDYVELDDPDYRVTPIGTKGRP
jgi:DNA replication protein DnaC